MEKKIRVALRRKKGTQERRVAGLRGSDTCPAVWAKTELP